MPPVPSLLRSVTKPSEMTPFWQTADKSSVRLYLGDVREVLSRMPEKSVHCCVTSPPYWGLRDYGTGEWVGEDRTCIHIRDFVPRSERPGGISNVSKGGPSNNAQDLGVHTYRNVCGKCGAVRIDKQLGSEASPDCGTQGQAQCGRCFVCSMVGVFREVRRVLRDDGTLWLNLGDTYTGGGRDSGNTKTSEKQKTNYASAGLSSWKGLPSGNLVGVPWRVALALQADGWVLRQDVIWHKPSPMPESVRNRCTKAHEYVFLLTKSMRYFYDAEAIKEKGNEIPNVRDKQREGYHGDLPDGAERFSPGERVYRIAGKSNKRSVWTVSSQGYAGAHFATFPPKLIEPMILAGTSEKGCCGKCGAPWRRVTEEKKLTRERPNEYVKRTGEKGTGNYCSNTAAGIEVKTIGWESTCECVVGEELVVPCTVLDPFIGSGTTCCVSLENGRRAVGIDLSEKYLKNNAVPRIEGTLLDLGQGDLISREIKSVNLGGGRVGRGL